MLKILPSIKGSGTPKELIVDLIRIKTSDQGTLGWLRTPDGLEIATIELPWRENKTSLSCIPSGEYKVEPWNSKKFGKCWHLTDTTGRTYILIHKGNVAGDKTKGLRTHSSGCIIIGKSHGKLYGQDAVLNSGGAMSLLQKELLGKSFKLIVRGKHNGLDFRLD